MSTDGMGIDNLYITSFKATSKKSALILKIILVVKTVAQLEFRCSDITVCTLRTGKAYCL
jgi:hypothetical protein